MDEPKLCWDCTLARGRAPAVNDFFGQCARSDNIAVRCDGCGGQIWVDHKGRRVDRPVDVDRPADSDRPPHVDRPAEIDLRDASQTVLPTPRSELTP